MYRILLFVLGICIAGMGCRRTGDVRPGLSMIALRVPANFPAPAAMEDNPLSKEGIELGRRLFYDTRLSGNNGISCATCHQQGISFSDGLALSTRGFSGKALPRHAPALMNLAWMSKGFFWDGGSTNLESQAFGPITSVDEMHQNLIGLVQQLQLDPYYARQFDLVFSDTIRSGYIVRALAQFERTLISAGSRYDKFIRKEVGASLSPLELQGLAFVRANCQRCHEGELFTDNGFHNNGIDSDFSNASLEGLYQGRYRITNDPADLGKFKTPTLRNIMLTAPYMHDGRFRTMDEVLDHYSNGINVSATTDSLLARNGSGNPGIPMTANDKQAIIAFMKTLTDSSFISNKEYSSPFN